MLTPPIDDVKARMGKIVQDSGEDQGLMISKIVNLRQEQYLSKVSRFMTPMKEITSKLDADVVIIPVGKHAAMLDTSNEINFG